jgi:putative ABC transport system permease protein
MLLVVGAGLMLRSFLLLNSVDPGFRPDHLLTFRMMLLSHGDTIDEFFLRRADLVRGMLAGIRSLPMVKDAGSIHLLPLTGMQSGTWFYRLDRPKPPIGSMSGGDISVISDRYFETMGIPLVAGREFDLRDRAGSPLVAVLNRAAAQRYFPGENPLGKRMSVAWSRIGKGPNEVEIVGVAADIRHNGLDVALEPCMFLPQAQQPSGFASLLVRINGDPQSAIEAVRQQIRSIYASQGIQDIQTMDQVMSDYVAKPRLEVAVLGIFGALALLLACVGTYAVISYSVEQRMREMGIRAALGAAPRAILRMVLREGLLLAAAGIAGGVVSALVLTRYLAALLYAVKPTDPLVYTLVGVVLALSAIAGCYFPARRATRVDPAIVLREE